MKAIDVFGIIVRTIGLLLIAHSVTIIPGIFAVPIVILTVMLEGGAGACLFFCADLVVDAAYRSNVTKDFDRPIAE
jgi:hypothetical protein